MIGLCYTELSVSRGRPPPEPVSVTSCHNHNLLNASQPVARLVVSPTPDPWAPTQGANVSVKGSELEGEHQTLPGEEVQRIEVLTPAHPQPAYPKP